MFVSTFEKISVSVGSVAVGGDMKCPRVKTLAKPGTRRTTPVATWERITNDSLGSCGSGISTVNQAR